MENLAGGDSMVRQDFILTLYRYAKHRGLDVTATADISGYLDQNRVSEYARTAMRWGLQKGL